MNHRTTAGVLASCALVLTAVLAGCGAHPDPAKRPEAGSASSPSSSSSSHPSSASPASSASSAPSGKPGPRAGGSASAGTGGGRPRAAGSGLPPRPDASGEAAYVRALTAIDPDIVHDDEDGAVARGRDQCRTIHDLRGDREGQIAAAVRRFTSPGHPQGFGTAKGARIVDAVHTNLCPAF
ncbi:hypothetical protein [Streptomyces sp. NPDC047000]|uniref:hypothetical protein n=1 Tax=Streptomyces sp. NPDC047000 TaxID=3155474 RepID=UPI00340E7322